MLGCVGRCDRSGLSSFTCWLRSRSPRSSWRLPLVTQDGYSCARKRISYLTNAEAENASFASHPGPRDNRSECRSDVDVDRPSNPWAPRKILSSQLTQEAHRKRCDYFKTRIGRCRPRARTAVSHRGFRAFGGGDRMQLANRRFLLRAMCPPHFREFRFLRR